MLRLSQELGGWCREVKECCDFKEVIIIPGEEITVHAVSKKCQKAIERVSGHSPV